MKHKELAVPLLFMKILLQFSVGQRPAFLKGKWNLGMHFFFQFWEMVLSARLEIADRELQEDIS